ncbi:MAG: hypothetical protein ACXVEF_31470 [Polyangiales bacterium]
MGLTIDVFEFEGAPPAESELAQFLRDQIGSDHGLESYIVDGSRAELSCMLDVITRAYACAFLVRRGGVPVHHRTGAPLPMELPRFVSRPWRSWSWLERLRFRFGRTKPRPPIEGRYR